MRWPRLLILIIAKVSGAFDWDILMKDVLPDDNFMLSRMLETTPCHIKLLLARMNRQSAHKMYSFHPFVIELSPGSHVIEKMCDLSIFQIAKNCHFNGFVHSELLN